MCYHGAQGRQLLKVKFCVSCVSFIDMTGNQEMCLEMVLELVEVAMMISSTELLYLIKDMFQNKMQKNIFNV